MDPIIGSIITGVITAVGAIIVSAIQNRKLTTLLEYRMNQLEAKQDKHNSLMERTFLLEHEMTEVKEEIKDLRKRD